VCVNHDLRLGSMLPFVEFARENKMACIIFNPNYTEEPISKRPIR